MVTLKYIFYLPLIKKNFFNYSGKKFLEFAPPSKNNPVNFCIISYILVT